MAKETRIKAYCNIVINKRKNCNPSEDGLKIDLMGTNQSPYFCIFPQTKKGLEYAEGNYNGYEEITECEIIIKKLEPHKCNCDRCTLKQE